VRPWWFLSLLCPASLPALSTAGRRTAIPLPAPLRCRWWREQALQDPSHLHHPWAKLRAGCDRELQSGCRISAPSTSILPCRGPPALPILSQHPQVHFKNMRCIAFSCCLLWLACKQGLDQVLCIREQQSNPAAPAWAGSMLVLSTPGLSSAQGAGSKIYLTS